ncbi:DUF3558 family protein [Mycobacterium hubeiense]|uniref:DUF3558 family protein n=1 Tax=Mycobacterium hubeiense TaxID=1867256 RepID=UPI001303FD00|nr:DUF3558 family protein [Mycobacterium sp. QGD 101]
MLRTIHAASAAVLLTIGCSTTTSEQPSTPTDLPPAATSTTELRPVPTDLPREQTITWARDLDPCALIDRSEFESLGAVTALGTSSNSTSCEAVVDERAQRPISVGWSIAFTPTTFLDATKRIQIDGVAVYTTDVADALPPGTRDQLVESGCEFTVPFENSIAVRMSVSMERDRNACAVGEPLVRNVLANWPDQPRQGTSPATTVTVLTNEAPCAVVARLRASRSVAFDWADQSLTSCFFTVDGIELLVSFDYRERGIVTINSEPTKFGDHDGYSHIHQGTAFAQAIVGGEFGGVWSGRASQLVPVVEVTGDDATLVSAVMTSALDLLPA